MWVWLGLVWARYFTPSLPSAAAAVAPGEAPGARAGATPRAGGVPGAAVGAAARLAGVAVSAPCAPGAPSGGGAAELAAWAAGWSPRPARSPGKRLCVGGGRPGLPSRRPDWHRRLRQPPLLALREGLPRASRKTGERERDQRWWRSSRWAEQSESDITVILVGMRGGRRALSTTSWCICGVRWAVLCSAPQGGGGEGRGGRRWRWLSAGGGRWPSIGTGAGGGLATRPTRRATAPGLGRGSGPWAPWGRLVVPRGAALGGTP